MEGREYTNQFLLQTHFPLISCLLVLKGQPEDLFSLNTSLNYPSNDLSAAGPRNFTGALPFLSARREREREGGVLARYRVEQRGAVDSAQERDGNRQRPAANSCALEWTSLGWKPRSAWRRRIRLSVVGGESAHTTTNDGGKFPHPSNEQQEEEVEVEGEGEETQHT